MFRVVTSARNKVPVAGAAAAGTAAVGFAGFYFANKKSKNININTGSAGLPEELKALMPLVGMNATKCEAPAVDWDALRKDICDVLDHEDYMEEPPGPLFVRLAWHSAGTYDKGDGSGGSCGATMRFKPEGDWGANAGLKRGHALLEPLKKKYPGVSYADLWIFASYVAIEEMGGAKMTFTPGRVDKGPADCPKWDGPSAPDGKLPSGGFHPTNPEGDKDRLIAHIRTIYNRMGFDDKEIVALLGAHALGRCHESSSGYWGPWTNAPTTMSNEYYRLLLENKWTKKTTHNGRAWKGPPQFESQNGELMMLPSDMALVWDPVFKKHVEEYAKDEALFLRDFANVYMKLTNLGHCGGFGLMACLNSVKSMIGLA